MADIIPNKFEFILNVRDVETVTLDNAPDGWLATKITYKSDTYYKALRRSLTSKYNFVFKGATILRREFWTSGILARTDLTINKTDSNTLSPVKIYEGKIDFSTSIDGQTSFQVDSISKDFTVQLDAYAETEFTLPLTGNDVIDITLPSLSLREAADLILIPSLDYHSEAFFQLQIVNYKQVASLPSVQEVAFNSQIAPDFTTTGSWFLLPRIETKARVFGKMSLLANRPSLIAPDEHYQVNIYRSSDGSILKTLWDIQVNSPSLVESIDLTFDFAVNLAQFETLSFYVKNLNNTNGDIGVKVLSGNISLEFSTATPPTQCKGISGFNIYKRLLLAMNRTSPFEANQPVPCQSYLMDPTQSGPLKDIYYTCADSVRTFFIDANGKSVNSIVGTIYQAGDDLQAGGRYLVLGSSVIYNSITYEINDSFDFVLGFSTFTTPDDNGFVKQIKSTPGIILKFKDFFQDIFGLQFGQAGLAIQNGLVALEDLAYFYRPGTGSLDLGTVDTTTTLQPANDLIYNTFKGGYKDEQFDSLNGLNEVNSEVIYVTDLLSPAKELNVQCVSCAAPYAIELARVTPVDTASSRSDNRTFILHLKDTPEEDGSFKPVQMDALASYSGVDASYYNWYISPKHNFKRGTRFLRSIFDKMDGYPIRVSAPKKSTALVCVDMAGNYVSESQYETISLAFGTRLFLPYYAQVNAGLPVDCLELIDDAPNSDMSFTWNDNVLRGFPVEISIDEGENSAQKFKLLLSATNKTLDLIR